MLSNFQGLNPLLPPSSNKNYILKKEEFFLYNKRKTAIIKCKTLNKFKTKIKSWCPDHWPCRLCKTYIAQLGFIWSAYIHLFMAKSGYILVTIVYLHDALVSFAVATIIFYMCLFNLYLNLLIYLCI